MLHNWRHQTKFQVHYPKSKLKALKISSLKPHQNFYMHISMELSRKTVNLKTNTAKTNYFNNNRIMIVNKTVLSQLQVIQNFVKALGTFAG